MAKYRRILALKTAFFGNDRLLSVLCAMQSTRAARNAIDKSAFFIYQTRWHGADPAAQCNELVDDFDNCTAMNIEFAILISGKSVANSRTIA